MAGLARRKHKPGIGSGKGLLKELEQFTESERLKTVIEDHGSKNNFDRNVKKLMNSVQAVKKQENDLFTEVSHFGVLLASLYFIQSKVSEAKSVNDDNIQKFPSNMNVLFLRAHLMIKNEQLTQAKAIIEEMKQMKDNCEDYWLETQCIPKVDYAYTIIQLGHEFYLEGIRCYEEALHLMQQHDSTKTLEKLKIIVSYNLIQTYNRMLNQGNIQAQKEAASITPLFCFERICQEIPTIIGPACITQHIIYQGRAYIELFDSYKKIRYRCKEKANEILQKYLNGIINLEPETWLQAALDIAPDDGHVLERLGRHYRSIASSMEEFQNAAQLLENCTAKYPSRHVALHHLSLCYRSMWIEENGFVAAELHRNDVRNGKKGKKYGNKKKKSKNRGDSYKTLAKDYKKKQNHSKQNYSKVTVELTIPNEPSQKNFGNDRSNKEPVAQAMYLSDEATGNNNHDDLDEGIDTGDKEDSNGIEILLPENKSSVKEVEVSLPTCKKELLLPKVNHRTLYPNKDVHHGMLPQHYSRPDYYDWLRTSNPKAETGSPSRYLDEAISCLQRANEIVHNTSCRYHIDLARLYISRGNRKEAESCFTAAKECDSKSLHDQSYLYEQQAMYSETLLRQQNSDSTSCSENKIYEVDVISTFRTSVICAVRSREKSRMAFYQLKYILAAKAMDEKIKGNTEVARLYEEEHILLLTWIEKLAEVKGMLHELEKTPEVLHLQWELVYSFCRSGDYHSAFQYMILLLKTENIQRYTRYWNTVSDDIETPQKRDQAIDVNCCFSIAFKVAEDCIKENKLTQCKEIYRDTFCSLYSFVYCCQSMRSSNGDTKKQENKYNVVLISDDDLRDLPEFMEFLSEYCSLETFSCDDILPGESDTKRFGESAKNTDVILIEDNIFYDENFSSILSHLVMDIKTSNKHQPKVCIGMKERDHKPTHIPSISVGHYKNAADPHERHCVIELLYKALFVDYLELSTKKL